MEQQSWEEVTSASINEQSSAFLERYVVQFQASYEDVLELAAQFKSSAEGDSQRLSAEDFHSLLVSNGGPSQSLSELREQWCLKGQPASASFLELCFALYDKTPDDFLTPDVAENVPEDVALQLKAAIAEYRRVQEEIAARAARIAALEEVVRGGGVKALAAKSELATLSAQDSTAANRRRIQAESARRRSLKMVRRHSSASDTHKAALRQKMRQQVEERMKALEEAERARRERREAKFAEAFAAPNNEDEEGDDEDGDDEEDEEQVAAAENANDSNEDENDNNDVAEALRGGGGDGENEEERSEELNYEEYQQLEDEFYTALVEEEEGQEEDDYARPMTLWEQYEAEGAVQAYDEAEEEEYQELQQGEAEDAALQDAEELPSGEPEHGGEDDGGTEQENGSDDDDDDDAIVSEYRAKQEDLRKRQQELETAEREAIARAEAAAARVAELERKQAELEASLQEREAQLQSKTRDAGAAAEKAAKAAAELQSLEEQTLRFLSSDLSATKPMMPAKNTTAMEAYESEEAKQGDEDAESGERPADNEEGNAAAQSEEGEATSHQAEIEKQAVQEQEDGEGEGEGLQEHQNEEGEHGEEAQKEEQQEEEQGEEQRVQEQPSQQHDAQQEAEQGEEQEEEHVEEQQEEEEVHVEHQEEKPASIEEDRSVEGGAAAAAGQDEALHDNADGEVRERSTSKDPYKAWGDKKGSSLAADWEDEEDRVVAAEVYNPSSWLKNMSLARKRKADAQKRSLRRIVLKSTEAALRERGYDILTEDAETVHVALKALDDAIEPRFRVFGNQHDWSGLAKPRVSSTAHFVNGDTIDVALWLQAHKSVNPVVVVSADPDGVGGSWEKGSVAQEEEVWRRSALSHWTRTVATPVPQKGCLYFGKVAVFREGLGAGYAFQSKQAELSFLCSSSLDHPKLDVVRKGIKKLQKLSKEDAELLRVKVRAMLGAALEMGHDAIVIPAFGCGFNGAPAAAVAPCFVDVITSEFTKCFKHVTFAIVDTEEASSNFSRFQKAYVSYNKLKKKARASKKARRKKADKK